ncbi:MAG: hypothetical protein IPL65_12760 [Lewinellaceae bacterium]|nr:hypothetical protein [Lewinellaceae bacterium]
MRPFLLTVFIALSLSPLVNGQSEIQDAIALRQYLKPIENGSTIAQLSGAPEDQEAYLQLLLRYIPDPSSQSPDQDVPDAFFGNPFISDQQGVAKILLPATYHSVAFLDGMVDDTKAGGSIGSTPSKGMFVTNLADGLAGFLVKRTKQELTIAFFRDFQDKIKNNAYLNVLFPETASLLGVIGTEIYQYNTYLNALRQNYGRDMKALPSNLQKGLEQFGWLNNQPMMEMLTNDLLGLSQQLVDGGRPADMIRYMGVDASLQDSTRWTQLSSLKQQTQLANLAGGFRLLDRFSSSLQDTSGWMKRKDIEKNLRDPLTLYLYLGLMYQKAGNVSFSDGRSLQKSLQGAANTATTIEQLRTQAIRFVGY